MLNTFRLLLILLPATAVAQEPASKPVDFARQVLPVLSNKCFLCHGPDSEKVSDLKLNSFEAATKDLGDYAAIVPGKPEASHLITRIHDADDPMPPVDADKQLTDEEKDLLTRWIAEGAKYAKHWAYVEPQPVDSSIDELIEEQFPNSISFAPEADPAVLARRAALVLTGLPPEPNTLARFIAAPSEKSYEQLIDELLASERYGEHQARYWLDAVRYGDTHGLHLDNRRGIYPYRDWVIRAFNRNQAFDEFLTWQLAGDLLPKPTLEQQVATGFVRMNPTTSEGGVIPAEFQAKNNFDRVETLGTALLGASFVCARCHTHKYDPITHTEYFQLVAFFNSTAESPLDGNSYTYGPTVKAPADIQAWKQWEQLIAARDSALQSVSPESIEAAIDYAQEATNWSAANWKISPAVSSETPAADITDWKETSQAKLSKERFPKENQIRWITFELTTQVDQTLNLDVTSAASPSISINGEPQTGSPTQIAVESGTSTIQIKIVGSKDRLSLKANVTTPWKELAGSQSWTDCSKDSQLQMLTDSHGPLFDADRQSDLVQLAKNIATARSRFTTTLVTKELAKPRETRLLLRGEYNLPDGDPLQPAVPMVMGELPGDAPRNRLGLAQWLTSNSNPLVARVLVNRFWQQAFGAGLVRTPEDFGLQGEQPTHPELLDLLAINFRNSGWDVKALMKKIVMSRTFRQSSSWRDELRDPENRFYARGPGFRLDAEVLRDTALWAGGLLEPDMGGEGVKPWQPKGLWSALMHPASNTKTYVPDNDGRQLRRSVYVYWKRTSPHPMMTLFDAPNRESSCVRRSRSNTPLQSLGLLNETQRLQAARGLADRILNHSDNKTDRLNHLFRVVASRPPKPAEQKACLQLYDQLTERYSAHVEDAAFVSGRPNETDTIPHATWTQISMTVLASDIAILLY